MSILELEISTGPNVFYDNDFRIVLETHMEWLRNHPSTTTMSLDVGQAHKNQYDLYGLLSDLRVPKENHWATMRLNGYTNHTQFDEGVDVLLIPDPGLITNLASNYLSTKKK